MPGGKTLEQIEIILRDKTNGDLLPLYIDVYDSNLSRKWLTALNDLLKNNLHLEKNYCFMGFVSNTRDGRYICNQINSSIDAINASNLDYNIDDYFDLNNTITDEDVYDTVYGEKRIVGRNLIHDKFNNLHRYFEDLQGTSSSISPYYQQADAETRWHIRQLNLLCHEFESWALSYRKQVEAPDWLCPSQLMCWLNSPRFTLEDDDYDLFGIETLQRPTGGVFVGVNKGVGKHHWEVFNDEGRDSRLDELTTTTLNSQTEAAGDFDIEWGRYVERPRTQERLAHFREWLTVNGFDPEDPKLTIGHPQVGQVDLDRSFGNTDYKNIWNKLDRHLDVYGVSTSDASATYDYHWSDSDYAQKQIEIIGR